MFCVVRHSRRALQISPSHFSNSFAYTYHWLPDCVLQLLSLNMAHCKIRVQVNVKHIDDFTTTLMIRVIFAVVENTTLSSQRSIDCKSFAAVPAVK